MHRTLYVAHGASFAHWPLMLFTSCRLLPCNHIIANNYLHTQLFLSRTGRFFAHYANLVSSKAYKKEPFAAMMHGTRENIRPKQATRPPCARNECIFLAPPAIYGKKSGRLNTPDARPPKTAWRSIALPSLPASLRPLPQNCPSCFCCPCFSRSSCRPYPSRRPSLLPLLCLCHLCRPAARAVCGIAGVRQKTTMPCTL